ncbi:MAG: MFS transporter [Deltaproteobacteria bacterium]|nr:MFS transporter [Deltaproteobacteria bacterium]
MKQPQNPAGERTRRIDWLLLTGAMLGRFLSGLSSRIFMISLPTMAAGLGTDLLGISWALISFQLASISFSIIFGRVGDVYGRQKIYGLGFIVFTISTFLCGISQTILQLILLRFVQGLGSAMIESATRVLAMDAMPEGYEGKAQGIMSSTFHFGFFIGPPVGGLIIDYLHWRGVFFVLIPIALAGAALTFVRLGSRGEKPMAARTSIDYLGAALLVILVVMLTFLMDRKAAEAVGLAEKAWLTLAFAGVLGGFLAQEVKNPSPIMNLSLFRIRMFTFSIISLVVVSIARGLAGFLMPFYLQQILNLSPTFIGLMFLATPIFSVTLAPLGGHLADKVGPRLPATLGVLALLIALIIGITLKVDSSWLLPLVALGLTGVGTGFFNAANGAAIIGSVPRQHRGFATGMVHTGFDLGHMLGVSTSGLLMALAFEHYSGVAGSVPGADNPGVFVASMNVTYMVAALLCLLPFATSLMRGSGRIQAAG